MSKNDTENLTRCLGAQQSRLSRLAYVLTGDLVVVFDGGHGALFRLPTTRG